MEVEMGNEPSYGLRKNTPRIGQIYRDALGGFSGTLSIPERFQIFVAGTSGQSLSSIDSVDWIVLHGATELGTCWWDGQVLTFELDAPSWARSIIAFAVPPSEGTKVVNGEEEWVVYWRR
jgi:hypothetical protein